MTTATHYPIIAQAIRYLQAHARQQPRLEEVAQAVHLSPQHLQRVFSDFAGISPKRFLQVLTAIHAKQLLRAQNDVLSTTLAAGLSSPGRLHDLTLTCAAMTPGEIKSGGAGLTLHAGFALCALGEVLMAQTDKGLCHLSFNDQTQDQAWQQLQTEWPQARLQRDDACAQDLVLHHLEPLFKGAAPGRPLHVLLKGSNFQVQVWQALLGLPAGRVTTYGDLATRLNQPQGHRAVANAVAANAVAVLIPCHRVIRSDGSLSGYRWDPVRKTALLALEHAGLYPAARVQ
jgi:AraC family transcriptional regulator of adaptative response/methylated-DNA-[protein]-cysteine methyltransferase